MAKKSSGAALRSKRSTSCAGHSLVYYVTESDYSARTSSDTAANMRDTDSPEAQPSRREMRSPTLLPCDFVGARSRSTRGSCPVNAPATISHGTATACGAASTQCHQPAGIHIARPAWRVTGSHQRTPARGALHVGSYSGGSKVGAPRRAWDWAARRCTRSVTALGAAYHTRRVPLTARSSVGSESLCGPELLSVAPLTMTLALRGPRAWPELARVSIPVHLRASCGASHASIAGTWSACTPMTTLPAEARVRCAGTGASKVGRADAGAGLQVGSVDNSRLPTDQPRRRCPPKAPT